VSCSGRGVVQVEALEPSDRVLVLGESSMPQTCIKSDEVALMALFKKVVFLPAPDHSGRLVRQASCGVTSPVAVLLPAAPLCMFSTLHVWGHTCKGAGPGALAGTLQPAGTSNAC
jgi:hypothetical protein